MPVSSQQPGWIIAGGVGLLIALGIAGVSILGPQSSPPEESGAEQRARAASAYLTFEKKLNEIIDPKDARSEEQLQQILKQLNELTVPPEYQETWSTSDAFQRRTEWLADARALDTAVSAMNRTYRQLIDEANDVRIKQRNAPDLAGRARKCLANGRGLLAPYRDEDRIPGSKRITYVVVFQFPTVKNAQAEWERQRTGLEKDTRLVEP